MLAEWKTSVLHQKNHSQNKTTNGHHLVSNQFVFHSFLKTSSSKITLKLKRSSYPWYTNFSVSSHFWKDLRGSFGSISAISGRSTGNLSRLNPSSLSFATTSSNTSLFPRGVRCKPSLYLEHVYIIFLVTH